MAYLDSPNLAPERIMLFGGYGTGKTNSWFSVLNRIKGHAYVVDTDKTVMDFLDGNRFKHLSDRMTFFTPVDIEHAISKVEKWSEEANKKYRELEDNKHFIEDWLVVDRVDWLWDAAQDEFSKEVFGKRRDEHYMVFRKKMEEAKNSDQGMSKNPYDGLVDWPTIKARHKAFTDLLLMWPGHFLVCASEKELMGGKMDDPDTKRDYGQIGWRPAGEKKNGHLTRTVIRMLGNNKSTWRMDTVKDRERDQMKGRFIKDFALDYLMKVAGWKMVKE